MKDYDILAYYGFVDVENPQQEVLCHKEFLVDLDATGRIYISEQGINGQMSLHKKNTQKYIEWMAQGPFAGIQFKIQSYHEHVFPRLTIKYKEQLVALDKKVALQNRGTHVSPKQWREMLEQGDYLVLDVRNDYEWEIGHFEGAQKPPCNSFRDFPEYAKKIKEEHDPKATKVMMFCTGGIRCEPFSALLKEEGFEEIYQLEGGAIKYGQEEGDKHWQGNLFVFDDRLSVPLEEKQDKAPISQCLHCKTPTNQYYNCANMDCNHLFLSCPKCLEQFSHCCKKSCQEQPRVRKAALENPSKPFRKWYHYYETKEDMLKKNSGVRIQEPE